MFQGKVRYYIYIFSSIILSNNITFILFYSLLRTTKTGGLPHLSYVARKSEPLGTEFKNLVDGLSGEMMWLEVQEGKDRMKKKPYQNLGGTAACVMRGVKESCDFLNLLPNNNADTTPNHSPRLYFGDSWFGLIKAAINVAKSGHHACFMIKTGYSKTPKKYLEETMKDFPGGTWITLETEIDSVSLVCIGYKYNKRNILTFIFTKGAGSTAQGDPYEARFPDKFGNVCVRHVARPSILSTYFQVSNKVDLHNQARQYELRLEKKWVTTNPYFRLYTTMLGINVIDTWKVMKDKHSNLFGTIADFINVLCNDMLNRGKEELEANLMPVVSLNTSSSSVSSITVNQGIQGHTREYLKNKRQVRCIWCSRVDLVEKKTTMKCLECGYGFCRQGACWSHHVAMGGVPRAPEKGTKKRKVNDVVCEVIN